MALKNEKERDRQTDRQKEIDKRSNRLFPKKTLSEKCVLLHIKKR